MIKKPVLLKRRLCKTGESWVGMSLQVYEFNVPTFGKGVVFDVDHKTRAEQFRFFAEALKSARLKLYVPLFVKETQVIP